MTPFSSAETLSLVAELACCLASSALLGSTPRSLSQPATVSLASESCEVDGRGLAGDPADDHQHNADAERR